MSAASASLLVAHCMHARKRSNNKMTVLLSYAKVLKRRESRIDRMLNLQNVAKSFQMKLQLLIRQILRKVQNSLLGSYRHRFTHLSRFDRRNCEKTVDRIGLRRQLHFDAISRCFCSTFYLILCKRSRLCDAVYSLQSRIERDSSDSLSMPRNETIKISLKMTIFRRRQKSPFRFPLRSGQRRRDLRIGPCTGLALHLVQLCARWCSEQGGA